MFGIGEVKRDARASIKAALGPVLLISFVYVLITQVLSNLDTRLLYGSFDVDAAIESLAQGVVPEIPEPDYISSFISVLINIMSNILAAGFCYTMLLVSRRQKAGVGEMFDIFSIFLKTLGLIVLRIVYIFLWSLLFIIPGIIAAYRYSMALYVLFDRPEMSIKECLQMSNKLTSGNKGRIFLLELSFILWTAAAFAAAYFLSAIPIAAAACAAVINLLYLPYMNVSMAKAYNRLSGWQAEAGEEPEAAE